MKGDGERQVRRLPRGCVVQVQSVHMRTHPWSRQSNKVVAVHGTPGTSGKIPGSWSTGIMLN